MLEIDNYPQSVARVDEVLVALRRVIRAVDQHSKQLLQSHGLTSPQLVILKALADSGPEAVGRLARRVGLGQATVTEILLRLERRGLVSRNRAAEDRRRVVNDLTRAGKRMLASAPPPLQEKFTARFACLPPAEQEGLIAALRRLAEMMDAVDLDASPLLSSGRVTATPEAVGAVLSDSPAAMERGQAVDD